MKTIKEIYETTQTIQKSEFICTLFPVNSIDEVNNNLNNIRKKYYDATHHCYAYILGNLGEVIKFSDDGEPSQTAGVVIYDVLKKNELTNVLAVVTRYFGGIKLGAGGLVRAYSSSVANTLTTIKTYSLVDCLEMEITFPYAFINQVTKYLVNLKQVSKSFSTLVTLVYELPKDLFNNISKDLVSITKNEIQIKILREYLKAL